MLELLSNEEKIMVEEYIDAYATIPEMNCNRTASADYLLREWDKSKGQYLGKMFKDNLVLSKEISFEMSYEQIEKEMIKKFFDESYAITKLFDDFIQIQKEYFDFEKSCSDIYYNLADLFRTSSIIKNIYPGPTFELPLKNGKTLKIQHGCKVIKALSKIVAGFDLDAEAMEELRIKHSQVLNQKTLRGNLCLSIHPLDYMTMSDNDCGWSSCMSWIENGCYRQGTVEMMNSPMVVIAYLTAKEDMHMPYGKRWYNKKWRELYLVTPEMISNVKAYPYKNEFLTKIVLEWLRELANDSNIGVYDKSLTRWDIEEEFEWKGHRYTIIPVTDYMYNDFDCAQLAYLGEALTVHMDSVFNPVYSGRSECMLCGELDPELANEGYVVGICCDDPIYCDSCGDRVNPYALYELDGECFCEYCYDDVIKEDDITGEVHHRRYFEPIHLMSSDGTKYDDKHYIEVYDDNLEDKELMSKYFKAMPVEIENWRYRRIYVINFEQLTEEGKKLFADFDSESAEWITIPDEFNRNKSVFKTIYERLLKA